MPPNGRASSPGCTVITCSSLATIERRSGPMEARIDSSDNDKLYVTDGEGARYSVERFDIANIRHPGRPTTKTGLIFLGVAATCFALVPLADRADNGMAVRLDSIAVLYGLIFIAAGLPLLLHGMAISTRFHQAAKVRTRFPLPGSREFPRLACPSCP